MLLPAPMKPFNYDAVVPETAAALRSQAAQIRNRTKVMTKAIIEIGLDLLAVKQQLEHGQFGEWVEAECGFSERSAQRFMAAAKLAEGKNDTVSLLPPAIVYKLAAKSTPQDAIEEVIERVAAGGTVTEREVDCALIEAKWHDRDEKKRLRKNELNKESRLRRKDPQGYYQREERQREAVEQQRRDEEERSHAAAVSIIDTIGVEKVRFLFEVLDSETTTPGQILKHLRQEVAKPEASGPRSPAPIAA